MMRRAAFREMAWPDDPAFTAMATDWSHRAATRILDWVWRAFDQLLAQHLRGVNLDPRSEQPERDLTSLHFGEIQRLWTQETSGESAFYPGHEMPEFESRHSAKAQPPSYDLGFVLFANPRCIWPLEAKVLQTASSLSEYIKDVRDKFIAGIAAPFVGQAGMIGYLLTGEASEVFGKLERQLKQTLNRAPAFEGRDHRTSFHAGRKSSFGRDLPDLLLHHLVMRCSSQ